MPEDWKYRLDLILVIVAMALSFATDYQWWVDLLILIMAAIIVAWI